uniref:hypothetical protein n=1 Tax=Nocardia cyriacigeorgica TaxID=135487 RepID=UPI001C3F1EFF
MEFGPPACAADPDTTIRATFTTNSTSSFTSKSVPLSHAVPVRATELIRLRLPELLVPSQAAQMEP